MKIIGDLHYYYDVDDKTLGKFEFNNKDVFQTGGFYQSETFREMLLMRIEALFILYDYYAAEGGASVDSGTACERWVTNEIQDVYDYIQALAIYGVPEFNDYDSDEHGSSEFNWGSDGIYRWYSPDYTKEIMFDMRLLLEDPVIGKENLLVNAFDDPGVREAFEGLYPKQVQDVRKLILKDRLEHYDFSTRWLGAINYYIWEDGAWLSNVEVDETGIPLDRSALTGQPVWVAREGGIVTSEPAGLFGEDEFDFYDFSSASIYIGWPEGQLTVCERLYDQACKIILGYSCSRAGLLVAAAICLIWLLRFTGRKRPAFENTRLLWGADKVFVEVQAVALGFLLILCFREPFLQVNSHLIIRLVESGWYYWLCCARWFALAMGILWFLLSLVRIGKAGLFAKRSLFWLLIAGLRKAPGEEHAGREGVAGARWLAGHKAAGEAHAGRMGMAGARWLAGHKAAREAHAGREGVAGVRWLAGHKAAGAGRGFARAGRGIAGSGLEKVDLLKLARQEVAVMGGSFAEAGLEPDIKADAECYFVAAESQSLRRVVNSLLSNVRESALPGTRVFIELKEQLSVVCAGPGDTGSKTGHARKAGIQLMTLLEIKNVSAERPNIPPEELIERLKCKGWAHDGGVHEDDGGVHEGEDGAHEGEGGAHEGEESGLETVRDVVCRQNGWFEIIIDGDLFKAVVMLPSYIGR
ncbi:MAG: hypothetical protein FWG03_04850 [Clostridiales bacterium]|nr:hypothetical protein [Clostridiales bacterium]